jgi:hypothetical protein
MRPHLALAQKLLKAGLVLSVLGSASMAVGLLLLAASFEVAAEAFLAYLILCSLSTVGGIIAMLAAFLLE